MKKIYLLFALTALLYGCGNQNSKPSITENSVRKVEEPVEDFSKIPPEKLLVYIKAHYDLGEYKKAKKKLSHLMTQYPDSLNGTSLVTLKTEVDQKLMEEEEKISALAEKERLKRAPNAMNNLRSFKENGKTYYIDKSSPKFDTKECFYAYIIKDVYGPNLYLKIRYVNTEWLNIENFMVTVDQLDYTISGDIQKSETKGKKRYKHEILDKKISEDNDLKTLKAISNGDNALALYVGKNSYKKRVLSEQQKTAIRNVLDAYIFMGGTGLTVSEESYTNAND